eukprot:g2296.t1
MSVKYTDIDYKVYSDAALFVSQGGSPYDRTTYRYSPILSWLMLPNIWIHPVCGKLLFGCADVAIGMLIILVLMFLGVSKKNADFWACTWLFNPLSINMSSRGSADSIVGVLILLTIYLLLHRQWIFAGIMYGLAVHFRIYPAVYCLATFAFVGHQVQAELKKSNSLFLSLFSRHRKVLKCQITFAFSAAITFFSFGYLMYMLYGWQFVNDAFLHHITRADTRHNFSLYFYDLYLRNSQEDDERKVFVGLLTFIPQLLTLFTLSVCQHKLVKTKNRVYRQRSHGVALCFSCLSLTVAFVAFNKVCTAQYFVWYCILLPVALPFSRLSLFQVSHDGKTKSWKNISRGAVIIVVWLLSEWHWLYWAGMLEFLGVNTFLQMWFASIIFFSAQLWVLVELLRNHKGGSISEKELKTKES